MSTLRLDDTIVAVATAPGEAAIGLVRLSGPQAAPIAREIFRAASSGSRRRTPHWRSHHLYHGHIVDPQDDRPVDEVLLAYMRAPRTYTRQDMVEISAHGSAVSLREIVRLAVAAGARPAERGEMTLRAFLNGRLDLAQAEAVLDAVRARTPASLAVAVGQLDGGLSRAVSSIRAAVMDVYAHLEATIDFAEDDVPAPDAGQLLDRLRPAAGQLDALLATAAAGRLLREGARVAIAGRPNAGKSSLLNALLQTERAIVTPVPGTTRDVIEETLDLGGVPVVLADTAGIVESADPVERIGVARSLSAVGAADVVLLVVDGSAAPEDETRRVAALVTAERPSGGVVLVRAKADLPPRFEDDALRALVPGAPLVPVSAIAGTGLDRLRRTLGGQLTSVPHVACAPEPLVTSIRHRSALERARSALSDALRSIENGLAADFVCIDLRACLAALGEITGERVTDDLLQRIFSQFCIGK